MFTGPWHSKTHRAKMTTMDVRTQGRLTWSVQRRTRGQGNRNGEPGFLRSSSTLSLFLLPVVLRPFFDRSQHTSATCMADVILRRYARKKIENQKSSKKKKKREREKKRSEKNHMFAYLYSSLYNQ